jgi:hypothetical protein
MATSEDEDEQVIHKDVINQMHSANESEFNKKWNWLLLCKTIAEWLTEPYYTTLHRNLFEVLTFSTLIKEQVEILKSKQK